MKAPVDLLYNGGIGTYVKATFETHAQVGDKSTVAHFGVGVPNEGAAGRCA